MRRLNTPPNPLKLQSRLLLLAGSFLLLFSVILTLAPAARARSWEVGYPWLHWLGFFAWLVVFSLAYFESRRRIPDADPYLLPIIALMTGWGLLTIYRLVPNFGLRQTAWLLVSGGVYFLGLRLSPEMKFLRRYKYLWLTAGLVITSLTLIFGTDPGGGSVHAWLGCCGFYFQPSEPLKLLLIIFLAAYLSERLPLNLTSLPLVAPTLILTGVALLILLFQRDLGTASILLFLYATMLYIGSGRRRILLFSLVGTVLAGLGGYFLYDVIQLRVSAWFNPWLDPSGRSYQIVQSLLAVANGGTSGRGPGLGSPGLVPVAISDFIFTSIAEETGLLGTLALLAFIAFLFTRALRIALRAQDGFRRLLAAGIGAYIGVQSIVIIGGNIRLLPLTGVTLPFVSYGGSSLLTSFLAFLLLMLISSQVEEEPAPLQKPAPYLILAGLLGLGVIALSLTNAWWAVWRGPDLLLRTDNARRTISDRYVKRGSLLDRLSQPITTSDGSAGNYSRTYHYPQLSPIIGYTNPTYGQAGLEASLDSYLRGLQGNPARSLWWDHLVYGQPPPGLDVRLSIDLKIQAKADLLLGDHTGAVILLNAASGEILAMSSRPAYDPLILDLDANALLLDPASPLLNRAAQGLYPPGEILLPLFRAAGYDTWPDQEQAQSLYESLGFFRLPDIFLPVADVPQPGDNLLLSPLQLVRAAAAISNDGLIPALRLVTAVNTPEQGWVILKADGEPVEVFQSAGIADVFQAMHSDDLPGWQGGAVVTRGSEGFAWSLAGTLPGNQGTPLTVVVLLEEADLSRAEQVSMDLLKSVLQP